MSVVVFLSIEITNLLRVFEAVLRLCDPLFGHFIVKLGHFFCICLLQHSLDAKALIHGPLILGLRASAQ